MKIKAKIIRAATFFQAKNDCREYLCGFNITKHHVQATNGHIAVQMLHNASNVKKGIYNIKGNIPVKTDTIEFVILKSVNCVKCLDLFGEVLAVLPLKVIEGKFPKLEEKIITPLLKEKINNTEIPRLNPDYMGVVSKAFKKHKGGVDLEFRGANKAIIVKIASEFFHEEFGRPTIIIMPMSKR